MKEKKFKNITANLSLITTNQGTYLESSYRNQICIIQASKKLEASKNCKTEGSTATLKQMLFLEDFLSL